MLEHYKLLKKLASVRDFPRILAGTFLLGTSLLGAPLANGYLIYHMTKFAPRRLACGLFSNGVQVRRGFDTFKFAFGYYLDWNLMVTIYRNGSGSAAIASPTVDLLSEPDMTSALLGSLPVLIPHRFYARLWEQHPWLSLLLLMAWQHSSEYICPWVSKRLDPYINTYSIRWVARFCFLFNEIALGL
jgi:hypothetical protein